MSAPPAESTPATEPEPGTSASESSGWERFLHRVRRSRAHFRQFVGIGFCALLVALGDPWGAELFFGPETFWIGAGLVVAGCTFRLWASGVLFKRRTLACTGAYNLVRHPLYTGNTLIGVGMCLASGLWWSFPAWIAIMWLFYIHAIEREDKKLHNMFGEDWERWASDTPALLPRLSRILEGKTGGWKGWSLRQSLFANGEPIYYLLLVGGLIWLHGPGA